jgi:LTXXQ motif family protein
MLQHGFAGVIFAAVAVTLAVFATVPPAGAQPYGSGRGGMDHGWMMGPGMMGGRGFNRMCGPGAMGFAEWRTDRLEQILKLTDAQRPKFEEFKAASAKAVEAMRSGCTVDTPATMPARVEAMEKRVEAMSQAIKTVRPALDAFYAALTDEQKARLESSAGPHRFWRWREHW